ncbi:MAG: Rieske 2Fe-2S domain-containing protein [Flavobacteriaceae bacterium]|nr:Rieske 2Fe-2S domain-containing protein [Flavobacteriaceae bacterium]
MKNRRTFLKTACKPIVLASFGIPLLEACSSEETPYTPPSGSQNQNISSDPITIDIASSLFVNLQAVGGWINYTEKNLLLIRISETEVRAFDNSCPHQGNRDRWSFDGSNFECGYHNNTFTTSCSGSLKCYSTSLDGTILTITF